MANLFFKGEKVVVKNRVKSYVNPKAFDPTPPREKTFIHFSPLAIKSLVVLAILLIFGWILFASPLFMVKNIEIKGEARDETKLAVDSLRNKNIFLIGGNKAEKAIAAKQPGIKNIEILRGIPKTLIVSLVERDPSAVWVSNGKTYLTDKDGVAFKETDSSFPRIIDGKNLPVAIGAQVASPSFISYIRQIYALFPAELNFDVGQVVVPETTYQIELISKDKPLRIKLETTRPLAEQIADIKYVLDKYKDQAINLVDVRIPGFAYIR